MTGEKVEQGGRGLIPAPMAASVWLKRLVIRRRLNSLRVFDVRLPQAARGSPGSYESDAIFPAMNTDRLTAVAHGHGSYWMYRGTREEIDAWLTHLKDPAEVAIAVTDPAGMKVGHKDIGDRSIAWGFHRAE